ncbi:MAG: hypothetical protein AMJ53_01300 [Gammaproteobacteria bacterium SG8_11]|nr:MAG: hypothetical protein AMJ53_01300 [Gammaproteobacteria bacterium SG8_11]
MLSIATIKSTGVTTNYFAKDDYYAKEEDVDEASMWYGKGADMLGLEGSVKSEEFRLLLEGRLLDGTRLGRTTKVTFPSEVNIEQLLEGKSGVELRLNDVLAMKLADGRKLSKLLDEEQLKDINCVRSSEILDVKDNMVKVRHHRPGWDFTFSAPKSVSILYEVGGDDRLLRVHEQSVSRALDYLQANAVQTRIVNESGKSYAQTDNLIIARFTHDTSREMDPQLHTHSVIMNATQLPKGEWRSIESRSMFRMKMLAGAIYRAELARGLKALSYEIEQTHADGRFEASVVPKEVIKEFSTRRQQIEERLQNSYVNDAKRAEEAAIKTRSYKREEDRDKLRVIWSSIAKELGFDAEKAVTQHRLFDMDKQVPSRENSENIVDGMALRLDQDIIDRDYMAVNSASEAVVFGAAKLGERESVFLEEDLIKEALVHAIGDVTVDEVQEAIKDNAKDKQLISATLDGKQAWTTPNAIYLERSNVAIMWSGQNSVSGIYTLNDLQSELDRRGFTPGQRGAAELILTTNDRITGVQGFAGTGKTYMLDAVREFAENQGFTVKGFSQAAAAANVLQQEAGIESNTIAQHLIDMNKLLSNRNSHGKDKRLKNTEFDKQLWVVDEASMISSRDMFEFLKYSERVGARVVLVGDRKQLPAVEAGKPFAQLQRAGMAVAEMRNILRQLNEHLRAAVYDSIDGHARRALERIKDHVHEIVDKDLRLQAIVKQYLALPSEEREKTLVLSPANEDRVKLNDRIRHGLQLDGTLTGNKAESIVYIKEGLTQVERARASSYETNQVVRFKRGYRSLGVEKGEYARVIGVDKKNGELTLRSFNGKEIRWQPHKLGGHSKRGGVAVYREEKRDLMRGDKVRWTDNDKTRGIHNAEHAQVEKVTGNNVTFRLYNGEQLEIDIAKPENKHWDHIYTSTVFSAQGQTASRVLIHGEDWRRNLTNQKTFYVGLSRPKLSIDIYVNDKAKFITAVEERTGEKSAALESVKRAQRDSRETTSKTARDQSKQQQGNGSGLQRRGRIIDKDGLVHDNLNYNAFGEQRVLKQSQKQQRERQQRQEMERETSR